MDNKFLVEECFHLTPRDVECRFDHILKIGVNNLKDRPEINFWFDEAEYPTHLFISVDGSEPQDLVWELDELTFGEKAYFHCPCGHRASKLYLPPDGTEFKCRKCHKLRYELSIISKDSIAGKSIYQINRLHKLANSRASMDRIFYNGQYTKRFNRFLKLCERAGLDSIVKGANDLKTLLNK